MNIKQLKQSLREYDIEIQHKSHWIEGWATRLIWLMVAMPLVLSFAGLRDYAAQNGVSSPVIFALVIDVGQLVFKIVAFRASMKGRTDWFAWGLTAVAVLVSVVLNVLHVEAGLVKNVAVARFMAGFPPVMMFLSVLLVARMVKEGMEGSVVATADKKLTQAVSGKIELLETAVSQLQSMTDEVDAMSKEKERMSHVIKQQGDKCLEYEEQLQVLKDDIFRRDRELARIREAVTSVSRQTVPDDKESDMTRQEKHHVVSTKKPSSDERKARIKTLLSEKPEEEWVQFYDELADWAGVSKRTIQRDVSQLNGVLTNG